MPRVLTSLLACLLLAACGDEAPPASGGTTPAAQGADAPATAGADEATDGWPSAEVRRLQPDHEPTPFSAEQIRRGCGPRSRRVLRFELPGEDTYHRLWTFADPTAEGATWHDAACDEHGVENGLRRSHEVTWRELQSHASFPVADVTTSEARLKTPAGTFDCMHYVVRRQGQAGAGEDRYWFAWDLPGPPVRLERYVNGQLRVTVTLVKVEGVEPSGG